MSSRERFRQTMGYGTPDRVPYFEEGIRKDVLRAWRTQGLAKDTDLATLFPSDHRERIEVDLEPLLGGHGSFELDRGCQVLNVQVLEGRVDGAVVVPHSERHSI